MARAKKVKQSLESIFFSTPEQKLMRFLLSEPTSRFSPRVLSSKLKGVRGLGGPDGIVNILKELEDIGLVQFSNNRREVSIQDDQVAIRHLKVFGAMCDIEELCEQIEEFSSKGILYGSRSSGEASSESDYNLFVVTDEPEEVARVVGQHPIGRRVTLETCASNDYVRLGEKNKSLACDLDEGIVMWGSAW